MVGLDVIGEHVTEINVTSPTGMVEIAQQTDCDPAKLFVDALQHTLMMLKHWFRFCLSAGLMLSLVSCKLQPDDVYHQQSYVFGTLVDITIAGETDEKARYAANAVAQTFQRLHNELHAWQPSKLSTLNQYIQVKQPTETSTEIIKLLRYAQSVAQQSDGLFNPAIGELIQAWGFHSDSFATQPPDAETIVSLVEQQARMTDLTIREHTVTSSNPHVQLDFGGIAKGYALDLGVDILKSQGIQHALINIGGNVIALGQHGDKPWRVGIQHPRVPNAIAALDLASGWAIGTSGDYQRHFIHQDQRYCHIINPKTGYPPHHTQSVTVLIPPQPNAGMQSDVMSKPIFIAPIQDKLAMAKKLGLTHVMVITANGDILVTKPMQSQLEWLDPHAEKRIQIN